MEPNPSFCILHYLPWHKILGERNTEDQVNEDNLFFQTLSYIPIRAKWERYQINNTSITKMAAES